MDERPSDPAPVPAAGQPRMLPAWVQGVAIAVPLCAATFFLCEWRLAQTRRQAEERTNALTLRIDQLYSDLLRERGVAAMSTHAVSPVAAGHSASRGVLSADAVAQQQPERSSLRTEMQDNVPSSDDNGNAAERNAPETGKQGVTSSPDAADVAAELPHAVAVAQPKAEGRLVGRILVLHPGQMRAVISAGADADLAVGRRLTVWRDDRCLGELRVARRYADMTVCEIASELQGGMRVNDQVRDGSRTGETVGVGPRPVTVPAKPVE